MNAADAAETLRVASLGTVGCERAWRAMREFTEWRRAAERRGAVSDELWLLEHPAAFTLGLAADAGQGLRRGDIPLLRCDRGGQVTYHGPGQLVAYWLCDLRRRGLGVRDLVRGLERGAIDALAEHGVAATRRPGAPGAFVGDAKIASLGLRVRCGLSYHGLSINVDGDLSPFARIDPCGFPGLAVTSIAEQRPQPGCPSPEALGLSLAGALARAFGYRRGARREGSLWWPARASAA